jgi:hypothetical protein
MPGPHTSSYCHATTTTPEAPERVPETYAITCGAQDVADEQIDGLDAIVEMRVKVELGKRTDYAQTIESAARACIAAWDAYGLFSDDHPDLKPRPETNLGQAHVATRILRDALVVLRTDSPIPDPPR